MAELKARFSLIDEMSAKLESMAQAGNKMADRFESAGSSMSSALDNTVSQASNAVSSLADVSNSLNGMNTAANNALSGASSLSDSMSNIGSAAGEAVSATDNWTKAAENYDKSALEAVYSTEQLVAMGYKTADAMFNEESAMTGAVKAADNLNSAWENSVGVHSSLTSAFEQSTSAMTEYADSGKLSADMLEELSSTSKTAEQALNDLENAANQAKEAENNLDAAMDSYMASVQAGTPNIAALETAQNQAAEAAANLSAAENAAQSAMDDMTSAEEKAKKALDDLGKSAEDAGKDMEDSGKKGVDAFEALADTVIAGKIADTLLDSAKAAYELADAFSEAEKVVVNATGATGEALSGLESSMMSAYANHSQDINTTAGAIGEINTRMALTGEKLTDVTGKFLDYSRITGSDVVGSVQNVTKVMNQWGVEADSVESVLDKLAYAGQISGASVDNLSSTLITGASSFKEVGLSLDNTIQLLSDFELAGINGTTAVTAIRTAVNNFSKDGKNAQTELQSVITQISNMGDSADATALAVETFGSKAGQQLAAAIRNGTVSINSFTNTLDAADGTLKTTANAAETLGEKWDKSSNKMKAAFTSVLQPSIDKFSSGLASVVDGVGEFLNKHPLITGAITAIGVGLGVMVASIAAVTFATKVAIPALMAFGTTLNLALGPIGWIAAGATAVTGVIMLMSKAFSKSEKEVEDYNGTLKQCSEEISKTETAYQNVCDMYGENSAAAERLKDELDTLNAQYAKGGGFIADYTQRLEESRQTLDSFQTDYTSKMNEIDDSWQNGMIATAQLEAISKKTELTNADLDMMGKYADYLNDTFNCNIEVNYDTGELTGFDPTNINSIMSKVAAENRKQAAIDSVTGADFTNGYIDALENLKNIKDEYKHVKSEIDKAWTDPSYVNTTGFTEREADKEFSKRISEAESQVEQYKAFVQEAYADMGIPEQADEYINMLEDMANGFEDTAEAAEKANEAMTPQEIAATVYEEYREEIEELAQAYDEVYQSALESFQGQFGLFEQASTESETYLNSTVENAQAALDSQLAYWESYGNNIEQLKNVSAQDLGITQANYEALMSYVQSGSEEAAGLAASMVNNINDGNKEAVANLANTLGDVNTKQSEIAATTADWVTNLSGNMEEIEKKMSDTVDNMSQKMDFSSDAETSAKNTLTAYANQIKASGESAVTAAQDIANRISNALASANTKMSVNVGGNLPRKGYATGTISAAPGLAFVGENGPEIIDFKGGERVYNNDETNNILSALASAGKNDYSNDISYLTNENSTEYSTFNSSQNTEIVNNYNSVQSGVYDDSRVISLLERMDGTFSAVESKIGGIGTSYEAPESYSAEPSDIIVDLSVLDNLVSKIRQGDEISNYSDNIRYGDTQTIDNSRNFSAEYGDNISNFNDYAENINNTDYSRKVDTSTVYGDNTRSVGGVEYGDIIKNSDSFITNYGETLNKATASHSSELSDYEYTNTYNIDNGLRNGSHYAYDSVSNTSEISSYDNSRNISSDMTADNADNSVKNYSSEINSPHSYSNGSVSFVMPLPIINPDVVERLVESSQSTSEMYYNNSVENNTISSEMFNNDSELRVHDDSDRRIAEDESSFSRIENSDYSETVSSKEIIITIKGEGEVPITVKGDMSKEEIYELVLDYMKPAIMSVISSEVLEEGESSYDY